VADQRRLAARRATNAFATATAASEATRARRRAATA
jgi:hypothetical protein